MLAGPVPEEAVGWRLELPTGAPLGSASDLRVATVFHEGRDVAPVSGAVTGTLDAFASRLSDAGVGVEAVPLPVPLVDGVRSWQDLVLPIIGCGFSDDEYEACLAFDDLPGDDMLSSAGRALVSRYRPWKQADQRRQVQRAAWAELFERYDVVLAPVMPTTAFPHDTDRDIAQRVLDIDGESVPQARLIAWCGAIGAVLLPVVTLPVGPAPDGLPVGVQVIGPYLSDLRLIEIARLLEQAAGTGFIAPP